MVAPTQTLFAPLIGAGNGSILTESVTKQPGGIVYVMVAVPTASPVTIPEPGNTDAVPGLLLDHVPPRISSANVVVVPRQAVFLPTMVSGIAIEVSTAVL